MSKLYQIHEDDLADLERILPKLMDSPSANLTNADRVAWRRVQRIVTSVRWNYGPYTEREIIPAGDEPPTETGVGD